jgi:hypothetical protein
MAGLQLVLDGGQIVLIHRENNGDGLKLRDGDDGIGISGVNDISRINLPSARPPENRGMNIAVG